MSDDYDDYDDYDISRDLDDSEYRQREEDDRDAHISELEKENDFLIFGIFSGFFSWLFGGK